MEFGSNKPIYLQICDSIGEEILAGTLKEGDRIPSVREYAAEFGVNPNTVARSYEKLTDAGVIFTKRGLGYFVAEGAGAAVLTSARREFLENEAPAFLRRMKVLGLEIKDLGA